MRGFQLDLFRLRVRGVASPEQSPLSAPANGDWCTNGEFGNLAP